MTTSVSLLATPPAAPARAIVLHTRGNGAAPIIRLMSPSDLGQTLKPFVFLDLFDARGSTLNALAGMPLHPHSGIATVTVFTEGSMRYDDPASGVGALGYGGVEWMRAGSGVWHGKEMTPSDNVARIKGFQLWLALPAAMELAAPQSHYIEASKMAKAGPAHVVIGSHDGATSPIAAPGGINYLLVTLKPGERWTYQPPEGHTVAWLAVAKGNLAAGAALTKGNIVTDGAMVVFAPGNEPISLQAEGGDDAVFVLGSAVPHPHALHLGYYSVHTSGQALAAGEKRIRELGSMMQAAGDRTTGVGTIPVFT